jgi:hypothetical protein
MLIKPQITTIEIELIQKRISSNPTWSRTRLSVELCRIWDWRYPEGHPKEISCRDLLRQLDAEGLLNLPPCKQRPVKKPGHINHIWIYVGETTGRSRNDRYNNLQVPIKDIYLYPLHKYFREVLADATQS